jgi:hypothetical protein
MACDVCVMSTLPPRKIAERKANDPSPRARARVWSFSFRSFEALAFTNTLHPCAEMDDHASANTATLPNIRP